MGGTAEHADNFVPVDECLVSFFIAQKEESKNKFQNQKCRGRSPLSGFGDVPKNPSFSFAASLRPV